MRFLIPILVVVGIVIGLQSVFVVDETAVGAEVPARGDHSRRL